MRLLVRRTLVTSLAIVLSLALLSGCTRRSQRRHVSHAPDAPEVVVEERSFTFPLVAPREDGAVPEDAPTATLGAALYALEDQSARRPAVVFVPGGGNISRSGSQRGDGVRLYAAPVDVTEAWAHAFAERGYLALAYDKRTCTPRDDGRCQQNPTDDVDREGPVALAKDVDAACALVADDERFDGRLILFAHGQAAAVALASSCAARASALVLVAPIPRRVDQVMIESLAHREKELRDAAKRKKGTPEAEKLLDEAAQLKNAAGSRAALFDSIRKGQFAEGARVQGATIAFWQGWLALTEKADARLKEAKAPRVVVVGSTDSQYAPADRARILKAGALEGITALEIEGADHHLLVDERLLVTTVQAVVGAVEDALAGQPAPAL